MKNHVQVGFFCQRCKQPLILDGDLAHLDRASFHELTEPLPPPPSTTTSNTPLMRSSSSSSSLPSTQDLRPTEKTHARRSIHARASAPHFTGIPAVDAESILLSSDPSAHSENPTASLSPLRPASRKHLVQTAPVPRVLQRRSAEDAAETVLGYRVRVAQRFFDWLSLRMPFDHPLCVECGEVVAEELAADVQALVQDRLVLEQALQRAQSEASQQAISAVDDKDTGKVEQLEMELDAMDKEMQALQVEWRKVQDACKEMEMDDHAVETEMQRYWTERNALESERVERSLVLETWQRQVLQADALLETLAKSNVYNDAFHIWHSGAFGTINGLRLGRLPDHPVEWAEINAAWGCALFLLDVLAEKLEFAFQEYRLVPLGSMSRIEKLGNEKTVLELYGSGDIHLTRLFWNRRFDQAMVAFLECLGQLGGHVEVQDAQFRLPYRINKDKIGDISIRLQFNQDELWTKACKYTLTNLKWLLAFVCKKGMVVE